MAELPIGYTPSQSSFIVPNQRVEDVVSDWNEALKALASNSAAEQEPQIVYNNQFYADPEQDAVLMRNNANTAFTEAIPVIPGQTRAFQSESLGLNFAGLSGAVRWNGSAFSAMPRSKRSARRWTWRDGIFTTYEGTGINPIPLTPYTFISNQATAAVSPTAGFPVANTALAPTVSNRSIARSQTESTRFYVEFQLAGVASRGGAWCVTARINNESTCKYFLFHTNHIITNTPYDWRPFLFRGSFWTNTTNNPITDSTVSIELRASYSEPQMPQPQLQYFHLGQSMVFDGAFAYVRQSQAAVQNCCYLLVEEYLQ